MAGRGLVGVEHPLHEWDSWKPMDLSASYFNLLHNGEMMDLWFSAGYMGADSMVRLCGNSLTNLNPVPPEFDTRIVRGYELDLDGLEYPIFSRASATRLTDGTEVVYGAIGPRYRGGASELYPALFVKAPGGEWRHRGPPTGEPAEFLAAARAAGATVRCEGGGLIQLPDGRLRIYLHGMLNADQVSEHIQGGRIPVNTLLIAEADSLEGPWKYVRDDKGIPVDVLAGSSIVWLFPHVQPFKSGVYMLTGGDNWPPAAVYAAYSRDGVHFVAPADGEGNPVPLIRKTDIHPDAIFCKTLRGVWMESEQAFLAVGNISREQDQGRSMLYAGRARVCQQRLERLCAILLLLPPEM